MEYTKKYDQSWAGGGWTNRTWKFGRLNIRTRNGKSDLWGRFGGGWNWKVGVQVGGRTVIFNLLTFSLSVSWEKKDG